MSPRHAAQPTSPATGFLLNLARRPLVCAAVIALLGIGIGGASAQASSSGDDTSLRSQLTAVQMALTEARAENSSLESQNEALSSDLAELRTSVDGLETQVERLQAEGPLPAYLGQTRSEAETAITDRGWSVRVVFQESSETPGTVLSQDPPEGTQMKFGSVVALTVAKKPPPAPVAPPSPPAVDPAPSNCHASYAGACLDPYASDYDCTGGSGNGPKYTGPVQVVGPDVFALDADNDGHGCE